MTSKKSPPSKKSTTSKDETGVDDLFRATASARKMAKKWRGDLSASLSPGFYLRYWLKRR